MRAHMFHPDVKVGLWWPFPSVAEGKSPEVWPEFELTLDKKFIDPDCQGCVGVSTCPAKFHEL